MTADDSTGPDEPVGEQPARRRWRRQNATTSRRTHRVEIKLDDAEYVRIRAAAEVQRCSMPAVFTRAVAADGSIAALKYQLLRDDLGSARRLMVQVSNNLNQAVRLAHVHDRDGTFSPGEFEAQLREVAARLGEVIDRVDQVVGEVGPG